MPPKRTLDNFFKNFLMSNIPKEELKQSKVYNMYKKPITDKGINMPHYTAPDKGAVYQADVLYLPTDPTTKEKYALVVVDVATKITDAEGMKDRDAKTVLKAFQTIFKRKILPAPKYLLQTDSGKEFDAKETKKYFHSIGVSMRFGKPGRSRMQALAEARNKTIATALFMRQTANELETGEQDTEWSQFLKPLIKEYNQFIKDKKPVKESSEPNINNKTILLEVGQKVRVMLDKPRSALDEKLHGNFRATDIRWNTKISTITNVIIAPSQPPLYQIDNNPSPAYTYNQLQTVDDNQEQKTNIPDGRYIIEKVVDERKNGRLTEYKVRWKGYEEKDDTWEPAKKLLANINFKQMIQDYKDSMKAEVKTSKKKVKFQ